MTYDERTVVPRTPIRPTAQRRRAPTSTRSPSGGEIAGRIVILLFGIVQVLIILRIVLLLLDRPRRQRPRVWILNTSQIFVAPFEGMLDTNA